MDTGIRGLLCYGVVIDIASYTRKYTYIQPRAYARELLLVLDKHT